MLQPEWTTISSPRISAPWWAVFLGAILATVGGFAATQIEWFFERRRRERNAALFFGEVLSTLTVLLRIANDTPVAAAIPTVR